MKCGTFLSLLSICTASYANEFRIHQVEVTCEASLLCDQLSKNMNSLKARFQSREHFQKTLPLLINNEGLKEFSYKVFSLDEQKTAAARLEVQAQWHPIIKQLEFEVDSEYDLSELTQTFPLSEGNFFFPEQLERQVASLQKRLRESGFPKAVVRQQIEKSASRSKSVVIQVIARKPKLLKKISIKTDSAKLHDYLIGFVKPFRNRPYIPAELRAQLDEAILGLRQSGYYFLSYVLNTETLPNGNISLAVRIENSEIFILKINGETHRNNWRSSFLKAYLEAGSAITPREFEEKLEALLLAKGRQKAQVSVSQESYQSEGQLYKEIEIKLDQGERYQIVDFSFIGNQFYSEDFLKNKLFKKLQEKNPSLFYRKSTVRELEDYLEKIYIEQGFLLASVSRPVILLNRKKKTVRAEFRVQEGIRSQIQSIKLESMSVDSEAKDLLPFSTGDIFNPVALKEQLLSWQEELRSKGYYFFELENLSSPDLVRYGKDFSKVDIVLVGNHAKKLTFNQFFVMGAIKTKPAVYKRYLQLKPGEVITASKLQEIETSLEALGLFQNVRVFPVVPKKDQNSADVFIQLVERSGGVLEIAPGYRTDLGLKVSGIVSYKNLAGMNREISLRGLINQRFSEDVFSTIDPRRRELTDDFLEYNLTLDYSDYDIFNSFTDYSASASVQKRRFFNFDADINRLRNTLSYPLNSKLSVSLSHQLEEITQFNALSPLNEGYFRIGALGPALTLDLRDNRVNPRKGFFSNLSTEFASPIFLSQERDDFVVNYAKVVLRNRVYFPFPGGVMAFYVAAGMQKNLDQTPLTSETGGIRTNSNGQVQTKGNIPSIKVFRLAGTDIVRGYDDNEINTIEVPREVNESGRLNVADYVVQQTAFMTNFKAEPRIFLNDNFMLGFFYDAGKVQVNSYRPFDLRQSVGLSLKYLTPVGTLDLDYGLKLDRRQLPDGTEESPGRIHISIGFF